VLFRSLETQDNRISELPPLTLENLLKRWMPVIQKVWGVVMVRLGRREVNFFASGKVTIREVNDIEEGKKLVHSILAMAAQKQFIKEQ